QPVANATTGIWTLTVSGLAVSPPVHSFTAKAMYGTQPVSTARTLTVVQALSLDPTLMSLAGYSVKIPSWPKTGADSIGNTAVRAARGGKPPYSYTSSSPAAASVDANGKVTGNRNGSAVITATDQLGQSASYPVAVSNVQLLNMNGNALSLDQAVNWMNSIGGTPITGSFIDDVNRVYRPPNRTEAVWAPRTATEGWVLPKGARIYLFLFADDTKYAAWCTKLS
uniref:Ig-like domain-containing protein n=1 Tax=Pseudomonas sp. TaxID=306 RepID=UPI00286AB3BF